MRPTGTTLATPAENLELPLTYRAAPRARRAQLAEELESFREFGHSTRRFQVQFSNGRGEQGVPAFVNEFWTAKQCQAHSLHEISYRACFKPQLPRFFIERLTKPGEIVYDPFMGRGTTAIEAALLGRIPYACDINPLSAILTKARLAPPSLQDVSRRLEEIHFGEARELPEELLTFYHPETLQQIVGLKEYLLDRRDSNASDQIDDWICLVAVNRLTGHSPGFFSVYTLPPNQAVSIKSQRRINEKRSQVPPLREVPKLILKKSRDLLKDCDWFTREQLSKVAPHSKLLTASCSSTPEIMNDSVSLVVTSPPFLNIVDYATDNWLRCWFLGIDPKTVQLTVPRKLETWAEAMTGVFRELKRILKPGGHVAFEVGEVHGGKTKLEETVLPCGIAAGLEPLLVLINDQKFTKTANCWGVNNNSSGTNTNRIVVFRK